MECIIGAIHQILHTDIRKSLCSYHNTMQVTLSFAFALSVDESATLTSGELIQDHPPQVRQPTHCPFNPTSKNMWKGCYARIAISRSRALKAPLVFYSQPDLRFKCFHALPMIHQASITVIHILKSNFLDQRNTILRYCFPRRNAKSSQRTSPPYTLTLPQL